MIFDPRIPAHDECVLGSQLERWATAQPDALAVRFHDGESWTWAEALRNTQRAAKAFQDLGVKKGDHVLSWQPNGRDALVTWFGLNYLGAVYVPLNTAYKGGVLEHLVRLSDASLIVCHADLAPRLSDIDTAALSDIIVTGVATKAAAVSVEGLTHHAAEVLEPASWLDEMPNRVEPWDTQYIIFTSGTTGPSKAVLSSYLQGYSMGPGAFDQFDGTDRILVNLPLFHVGGTIFVIVTLANGGSCYVDTHFRTDDFWSTVNDNEITMTCLLAAMIPFLLNLPPFDGERDHSLRKAVCVPWNAEAVAVSDRYGLESWTTFNMTEVSSPLISDLNPNAPGTCGRVRPGIEARVVDDNDCEVAPGEVGELILRSDRPWAMNHGYYKNPEATAAAWRNGWFHTGDGFRYDEEGYFYFVDRIKDAIRRRGENISSFEVENEVAAHPGVAEVAAIAVPSELGEDEVMVVIAPVEELPKTPTQKIQKHLLKSDGITPDTWDREAAGIKVTRDKIGS